VSWARLDGTDGRLFGRELGEGELSCWVSWVRLDGTDGRLLVGSWLGSNIVLGELGQT